MSTGMKAFEDMMLEAHLAGVMRVPFKSPPTTMRQLQVAIEAIPAKGNRVVTVMVLPATPKTGYYVLAIALEALRKTKEKTIERELLIQCGNIHTRDGGKKWYRNLESVRIDVEKLFKPGKGMPVYCDIRIANFRLPKGTQP